MKINSAEFCHLSSSTSFQKWLHTINYDLYKDLLTHLHKGENCASNRAKMVGLLKKLLRDNNTRKQLQSYLRATYPHMISEDDPPVVATNYNSYDKHNVFEHYDPSLLTFPRRLILTELEAQQSGVSLQRLVFNYCSMQAYCDHIIIDGRAYIEFLPPDLGELKDQIPAKNWQVQSYRTRNK